MTAATLDPLRSDLPYNDHVQNKQRSDIAGGKAWGKTCELSLATHHGLLHTTNRSFRRQDVGVGSVPDVILTPRRKLNRLSISMIRRPL